MAEAKKPTLREVVIDRFERGPLVGTPAGPIPDTAGWAERGQAVDSAESA
ncbi:hypothetical protein [Nocardia grenadensis]